MAGRLEAELPRRGGAQEPGLELAALDQVHAPRAYALAVERPRAEPALAMRVVDDGDAFGEHRLAQVLAQEAGAAGDRRAGDGAGQMAEHGVGNARIEHDRDRFGLHLARIEAARGALAGFAAD